MKSKHLIVAIAALLIIGGLWFARTGWPTDAPKKTSMDVLIKTPPGSPQPGQMLNSPGRLAPPDPMRRFLELTPEERVQRARQGPIGG